MIIFYLLTLLALAVYSYSQIDLNLTISSFPLFLSFQKAMVTLGYFQRPLSTAIFLGLLLLLFIFWSYFFRRALNNLLTKRQLFILIGSVAILGIVSYPAFSYDFFNYMFDIRIFTHYGQNPYLFKPLDFPTDQWLRFMHWVHRPYPYGPLWLVITFLPSLLGFGKFVLTAFNFKILFVIFYLGNTILISKILSKISPSQIQKGVVFFALSPLVIIEAVVSPHLDSVMAFFLLLSIYYLFEKRRVLALVSLLFSAGVKFLTLILLPVYFLKISSFDKTIKILLLIFLLALIPVVWQRELYPWYFLPAWVLLSLLVPSGSVFILALFVSVGLLLQYAPYLYVGFYPPEVQQAKILLAVLPVFLASICLYAAKVIRSY